MDKMSSIHTDFHLDSRVVLKGGTYNQSAPYGTMQFLGVGMSLTLYLDVPELDRTLRGLGEVREALVGGKVLHPFLVAPFPTSKDEQMRPLTDERGKVYWTTLEPVGLEEALSVAGGGQ